MDRSKLILLIQTLKYLKLKQVYYQLFYKTRNKFYKKDYTKSLFKETKPLQWKDYFFCQNSFKEENAFAFLNIKHVFRDEIDWDFADYGKLWTYNLNYFDFLNQEKITKELGLVLIKDYITKDKTLKDGKEPYPISLRGINWIKFLSRYNVSEMNIDQTLYNHYQILMHNLEYHLLGNHLLENGYSLLFGAYYFKDEQLYKKAKKILKDELNEQVLEDGAHFELSPMYHQILLYRLLDCINLVHNNSWKKDNLYGFLQQKAIKMLSWLQEVTFSNGSIPMVNDSTYDIAPESEELFAYAKDLGIIKWNRAKLFESGYRKIENVNYELFLDVGEVGPRYQPGHAHSDTFSFELHIKGQPVIVDTGISTYEKNKLRQLQRSTESHNTVKIGDINQTKVWSGFRVAERAKIVRLLETGNTIEATHNGYKKLGVFHTRKFTYEENQIIIKDKLSGRSARKIKAHLHFYPGIEIIKEDSSSVKLKKESIQIDFSGEINDIEILDYDYAMGFNKTKKGKMIQISFSKELDTKIRL